MTGIDVWQYKTVLHLKLRLVCLLHVFLPEGDSGRSVQRSERCGQIGEIGFDRLVLSEAEFFVHAVTDAFHASC